MARDYGEIERAFLTALKAETGKDLAEWMAAIAAQSFADKNQTIDWLRRQGFSFSRASWLERIHSNGGKPIYVGRVPARGAVAAAPLAAATPGADSGGGENERENDPRLERVLAAAKGYRPLCQLLLSEVRTALPGVRIVPKAGSISLCRPREFAVVGVQASELRLGLALGERPFDSELGAPRIKGAGPHITHMLVLTDARRVNVALIDLVKAADGLVNG
jgi:hypothetical protein